MSMVEISILKSFDAAFSVKWNPGLILRLFQCVVHSMKVHIISLSLVLFVAFSSMALQSYTYMTHMYLFPLFYVMVKRLN